MRLEEGRSGRLGNGRLKRKKETRVIGGEKGTSGQHKHQALEK
jgi:hypothetical protein